MFYTKHHIGRINDIHERRLQLIQQNYTSDFEILLANLNEKSNHQKFVELLMTEFSKYITLWVLLDIDASQFQGPLFHW